jgi:hypothetical protein
MQGWKSCHKKLSYDNKFLNSKFIDLTKLYKLLFVCFSYLSKAEVNPREGLIGSI